MHGGDGGGVGLQAASLQHREDVAVVSHFNGDSRERIRSCGRQCRYSIETDEDEAAHGCLWTATWLQGHLLKTVFKPLS